jgi:hypothetical protein
MARTIGFLSCTLALIAVIAPFFWRERQGPEAIGEPHPAPTHSRDASTEGRAMRIDAIPVGRNPPQDVQCGDGGPIGGEPCKHPGGSVCERLR